MIKQQNAGAFRSSRRRAGTGRAALMLSAGTLAMVLAQPVLAQTAPLPDALPTGGQVVGGPAAAEIDYDYSTPGAPSMGVDQHQSRIVVDWTSFDIGADASVHFDQSAGDVALNRVGGGDVTQIYGSLSGDGTIMILNPNGVLFGGGANVNVGGLLATTGSLANEAAFLGGANPAFTGAANAVLINAGADITVNGAGLAAFVAPEVVNDGVITATGGRVFLGGAEGFTLDLANDGLLELTVPTDSPLIRNHGDIFAAGGRIQMSAAAASALVGTVINTSGVLSVASASSDDGVIVLEAAGNDIEVSSDLAAEGDIEFNARRVFGAGDVDVDDGVLTLNIDPEGADTTGETLIADALGVIGAVDEGTTVNLGAGDYAAGANVSASNVTIDGHDEATIVVDGTPLAGLTISGDGVTVQNLRINGPVMGDHRVIDWNAELSTVGIVVGNGAENATITGNEITNIRSGIRMDGRGNAGAEVSDNYIENTKGAILVQYTDGAGIDIFDNSQGPLGNEWGVVLNLNTGTPLNQHATNTAQTNIMALSDGNNGMTVLDRAYAWSNRSHVWVDDDSIVTPADDFDYGNGLGNERQALHTVQAGVIAVAAGGTVIVNDGTYAFTSTLNIDKSLNLIGESMDGVFIDGSAINGYGMEVNADGVTLENFTFQGNNASTSSGHYGIKVQPDTGDVSDRLHDFTIRNVAIQGWGGTELDLNGVVGALIDGVVADGQNTKGVGIGLTDSADVTIVNSETLDNLWGSVALYQTNRYYDQQVDDITINADANSFGEALGVFAQSYSEMDLEIGSLNLTGFDFVVRNTGHRDATDGRGDEFTFFRTDQSDAVNFALNIGAAETSSIEGWSGTDYTNVFTVVDGLTIGAAIRDVRDGGFINVGAGTYNESVLINRADLTLVSTVQHGAVIDAGGAAFGINIANNAGDLGSITIDGFSVQNWTTGGINQSMSAAPFASVHVLNNRVFGPDGGAIAHGNGIQVSGDGSIVRGNHVTNTFLNSDDWAGSGILVVNGSGIIVEDNIVDSADVGIAVMNYNNASGMSGVTISGNQVSGASEGVSLQAYGGVVSGVSITGNTISGNESGLGMWNYNDEIGVSGVVSGNTFADNQLHVSSAFDGFVIGDVLSANSFDRTIHAAGGSTIYGDLSFAVSDAAAGSDLLLSAGTFVEDEQVLIDRDLTLTGVDGTIIEAGRNFTGANPDQAWWLVEEGVTFGLSDVTLDGAGFNIAYGLRNHGYTTIDDVTFRNIVSPGYSGIAVASFGGEVAGGAGAGSWTDSSLTITNSAFETIGRIGVLVKGDGATARIEDSVFTGRGEGDHVEYAVEAGASGSIEVMGNTISGYRGVASTDGSASAGVLVTSYYGGASNAVIENNVITGNTSAVSIGYGGTDVSVVEAFNNDLSGNDFGVSLNSAASADFSGNWWGFVADTDLADYMGGAQAGQVDFSTYLVSGADSAGAGFQGDFSVIAVTALGGQTGTGGRIQEGVNLVDTGGVVQVGAGAFGDRTITLNRSVTLQGAQSGTAAANGDGEAGAGDRGGETDLTGSGPYVFRVTAEDVTIDGFTFTGAGGRLIETSGTAHGLSITNNIFNTPSGHAGNGVISLTGAANDVLISNNLFGGDGGAGYLWLSGAAGDGLSGLTVQDNDFSGVSERGLFQGGQQFSGFRLSGNYFGSGILTGVNMGHLINPLIQGNHFDGVGYAAMQIGVIGGGTIRDNLVDGTGVAGYDFGDYTAAYGIQIWGGAYGTPPSEGLVIEDNTVLNYVGAGADDRFVGIYIGADAGPDIQVTGNILTGNSIGLWSASAASGLTLLDNTFTVAANGVAIRNSGSATIELMDGGNIIDGVDTDAASLEQLFEIEDLIDHGLDETGYGLVRVMDGHLFVTENSGSIQRAIDLAGMGETVNVGTGTFGGFATAFGGPADVTIQTVHGAIIDGGGGSLGDRIVDLRADGTVFSGFTIQSDGNGVGVSVSGRGVTVSGNVIEDVLTGVQTTTQYAAGNATITDNTITADYGVSLQNSGNTVSGNTVNAAVEGVGLLQSANSLGGNTFNVAAGADALNYYGAAAYAGLTTWDNIVTIEGGGLQGALDLAGAAGSVDAGAATYDETVTIRHGLTLTGAGQGDTIINGGVVIAGHAPAGSSIDGLTIEGLTINAGAGQTGLIALSNSIDGVYNTANLTVNDVTINGNGQHAVGLFDVNGATFDNVTINAAAGFNGVEAIGLNGFFMDGGAVNGALTGVNVWEEDGYEANGGLVFLGVDFADNRTHLSLQGAGAVLDAILSANTFDRTIHATDGDAIYGDLAWAVSDAAAGSELNLSADTFALTSYLVIDRTLTLLGAGQGQTIIDASGAAGYGIRVHADDVSLSDFTLSGGSGYGIKVEAAGSPTPDQRRNGFSIADVTIENTGRTGLDLNAVIGAMIDGVTVTGVANGNGISITDSADVTVRNTTTSGNAWGGLALYQRNNIGGGGSDQQLTDIVIEDSNDFGEDASVYVQVYADALNEVGSLTVAGFDFVVQNDALDGGATSYVFFDRSLQDAIDRGVNLANASESVVGGWSGTGADGNIYVGFGDLLGGGEAALSIQTAFDFSGDEDTIHIAGGDYGQSAILDEARTILFDDAGVGLTGLTLTTGAAGSDLGGRVTASGDIDILGDIILNDDLSLTGAGVSLAGVDGSSVNGQTLSLEADTISLGAAGAATALNSLLLFGDSTLTGAAYNASGFMTTGSTTLATDVSIEVDGALVMGAVDGEHALSIQAGTATLGEAGAAEALAALDVVAASITTAGATTTGDQSYIGALTLDGDYAAGGAFGVNGDTTLAGAVTVDADSDIVLGAVDGEESLILDADGDVILGAIGAIDALASLTAGGASITTNGAATTGGQSYTGALTLDGDYAAGGAFSVNGATTLGGDVDVESDSIALGAIDGEHALTLAAGSVSLGAAGADEALASLTADGASITTAGAATTGDQSYVGALTLDGDYAAGGAFSVNGATTLGGDATVDADSIALATVDGAHALALGADGSVSLGAVGANEALSSLSASGASITTSGAATTGGQSYAGALTLNGDYAAGASFNVNGATTLASDVQIMTQGDVMLGVTDGAHGLTISAGAGDVTLGPVGFTVAVDDLIVSGDVVTTAGAASSGAQSWSGDQVRLSGAFSTAGGDFTVSGPAILNGATAIATSGGGASLGSVDGATQGGQSFSLNAGSGSIELGSLGALARLGATVVRANSTVLMGDTYAANSLSFMGAGADATVRLTELLTTFNTVQSADQAGAISIAPHLIGTVDGEQGVVFIAGTGVSAGDGDITLGDAGSDDLRMGLMTASGGDFSAATVMLAGDFTSTLSGDQVFTDDTLNTLGDVNATVAGNERGPINAGGSVTITAGGASNGAITAGGPVTVTSGGNTNRVIISGGAVTLTSTGGSVGGSVDAEGPVTVNSSGTITGSYASGADIIFVAEQSIDVQVDGDVVQVDAPGGVVTGVFREISTDEAGTFVINGETVVGTGSADARQILIDGFIAPVGGVVGPTGLIQLPVGLALALVSPAGEGEGQRPAVLVNDVDRLGELLRLGYAAIVIQIDESGLLIEEELILADTEQQQAAGAH